MRVAVIGAGIAGLAAAERLTRGGLSTVVFEASDRIGGKVGHVELDGVPVPTAADAFLARRPEVRQLAIDVGLSDALITPVAAAARIFRNGELHPIPTSVLGVPTDLDELAAGRLISAEGVARARLDLEAPADHPAGDETVGAMIRRRLGDEVHEYLIDPLLGGINAGDSDRLSLETGAAQLAQLRSRGPSLVRSAAEVRAHLASDAPVFQSLDGGIGRLLDAVAAQIEASGHGEIRLNTAVETLEVADPGFVADGEAFDRVILATPAPTAAALLESIDPTAAAILGAIDYSSVALTLLRLPAGSVALGDEISGVLVPRLAGLFVTAVSVATNKWPGMLPSGDVLLRVSVGRRTDTRWQTMSDDEITDGILADLDTILGLTEPPTAVHVARWIDGLPQFDVDHASRAAEAVGSLRATAPGLELAGAMLEGLGLPACVASGLRASDGCLGQ